jgi:peptidoglycan hydrolase-like protein with peptidoglycan-binding domain
MLKKITTTLLAGAISSSCAIGIAAAPANAAITRYCGYTSSQPTLRSGSTGTAVKQAQCEINTTLRNTNLALDGIFGSATLAAVRKVQSCAHISVDGVIGPNTWSVLNYWSNQVSAYLC